MSFAPDMDELREQMALVARLDAEEDAPARVQEIVTLLGLLVAYLTEKEKRP